jgi:hypothetical protein
MAIVNKYAGEFTDRDSVARAFEVGTGNRWDNSFQAAKDFPSDSNILHAVYNHEGYEGSAFVLFKKGGKLYEVSGSHCSCYGLEGQWKPEETTWEALAIRNPSYYGAPAEVVIEAQRRVKRAQKANGK